VGTDGFHRVRVKRVVRETSDASSFVLDIPAPLRSAFTYAAGQYCTFRTDIGGQPVERCYSMSSAPEVDDDLQVTVKRVAGGAMSNWMNDTLAAGTEIDVSRPLGRFRLRAGEGDLVAYGAGSGITPVFSLIKSALATTDRRIRLLYANRDADSVIFGPGLAALLARHPHRLQIVHHLDADQGLVTAAEIRGLLEGEAPVDVYLCGPVPFMDLTESTLTAAGVDPVRIFTERFDTPDPVPAPAAEPAAAAAPDTASEVTIELGGRTATTTHRAGTTILQTARQAGLAPPFSCEAGNCATCMARLVEGRADMLANNALTDDEIAEGWVLTCQAVPKSPTVRVVYGFD
jgi:3-ketosteroid 9alpha-monooxygenase subunit B